MPTPRPFDAVHVFESFSPSMTATLYLEGIDQDEFVSMQSNFIEALLRLLCPSAQPGPVRSMHACKPVHALGVFNAVSCRIATGPQTRT
jgi:hypothetical protein